MLDLFDKYINIVKETEPIKYTGKVQKVQGMLIESVGPQAQVGELCRIITKANQEGIPAEVIGLDDKIVKLMSYENVEGIRLGDEVVASGELLKIDVGDALLGRVIDGLGRARDFRENPYSPIKYPLEAVAPDPMSRKPINRRIVTGIRAIDSLLAVGCGQRLGIFSGSGVGKSTLLGMIARNTNADINVIALIGERGREVMDFIDRDLGEEALKRSVIVVSTSDQSPVARLRGGYVATAVAEYFRDQGLNVMLLFDSITRFAKAQGDIGLARGEVPKTRGYPPSVFETLPKVLERSGTSDKGSITAFYTVLVDGDDMDEPISDAVRGILDGHIVLARKLAQRGQYPAIDVLASISRLSKRISTEKVREASLEMRRLLAKYKDSEDMILVGAYQKGTNKELDTAIEKYSMIYDFLVQGVDEKADIGDTLERLAKITEIEIPESEVAFASSASVKVE